MPDLKLAQPVTQIFKRILAIFLFGATLQNCHAADLENCKSDCAYYKSECIKDANIASQHELQRALIDSNPEKLLPGHSDLNQEKSKRRLEKIDKCDNNYSSCVIHCANPAYK